MTSFLKQKRALQASVALAACVPVLIGLWGVVTGFGAPGHFADSHYRYLSGILFGIGIMFWLIVPTIERQAMAFRILCGLVVIGGLARGGAALASHVGLGGELGLIMELVITPLLFIWRERLEARGKQEAVVEPAPTLSIGGPWG